MIYEYTYLFHFGDFFGKPGSGYLYPGLKFFNCADSLNFLANYLSRTALLTETSPNIHRKALERMTNTFIGG